MSARHLTVRAMHGISVLAPSTVLFIATRHDRIWDWVVGNADLLILASVCYLLFAIGYS